MSAVERRFLLRAVFVFLTLENGACPLFGQTTVGTGSIVGTVSDPSGAVISGAKITIMNTATGHIIELTTNSSGFVQLGSPDSRRLQNPGFGEWIQVRRRIRDRAGGQHGH
jgi:hypothetical protein